MKEPSVETKIDDCVFCKKIKLGDYETSNERCVAFTPLNPVTKGHLLVVHKLHTSDFTENSQMSAEVMAYASEIAALFYGEDVNLITSKGKLATQSINHLHIHLVPRTKDDGLQLPWSTQQAQTREEVKGLKKAPCEFEEEMGYHTKDCCHGENTYNQAITDVLNILGEEL